MEQFMEQVTEITAEYQWWIYGLLGLLLLFYLRRALFARREAARSIFKLEQEQSYSRYSRSVTVAILVVLLIAAVFALGNLTMPQVVETVSEPTPTSTTGPLVASTLTPTPPPATITPTATATKIRPTRPPQPTVTSEVAEVTQTPVVRPPACPNPNVRLTSPGVNQVIRSNVAVQGSANTGSFQYYKVEVGPGSNPRDHEWTVVGQLHHSPVSGGVLETFNAGAYAPGTYTLRLVVVDQTGNFPEPCRVTVSVQR